MKTFYSAAHMKRSCSADLSGGDCHRARLCARSPAAFERPHQEHQLMWRWLCALLHRFHRSESGMSLPIIALSFMGLVGSVGLAVDAGRMQLVQSKLSGALDAAGLAAGATVNTINLGTEVNKYMAANFKNGYLGATLKIVSVTPNANNSVFTLYATAEVPTTFMSVFGFTTSTVRADAEITRTTKGLELVMVLDNTGSMAGAKLTSLKNAANSMVNILYNSNNAGAPLWIGLVPFAQAVNIGTSHAAWTDTAYTASKNWGKTSWMGCVDARFAAGRDVTDDPPAVEKFNAYFWPSDGNNSWSTTSTTLNTTKGPNKYCSAAVVPMTNNKTTITTGINAMTADGNTHINVGAVWGWAMVSPRWRGLWGGVMDSNSLPLDYNTKNMNKAVVIMTDGENTHGNSSRTAYWYLSDNKLGTTNATNAVTQLDNRLSQVCTAMKAKNIFIYTIMFGTTTTANQNLLKACATQPDFFFPTVSDAELQAAFSAIGDSLANLRVSK
jgi:Flp pilus assembly protein TadG